MNKAHKESLELLDIIHSKCMENGIIYTIAANTLISYENGMEFDNCIPIIYIALMYHGFAALRGILLKYCEENKEYSFHDYSNTEQFDTLEAWFVKEPDILFSEVRKKESFYYGTRLIITPLFYAGDSIRDWMKAYSLFKKTLYTLNARAVLKGKPIISYIRLSPKRIRSNHYIKLRGRFSVEKCLEIYGNAAMGQYVVYPHIVGRYQKNPNSLPRIVTKESQKITYKMWIDVEEINLYGHPCCCIKNRQAVIRCFPDYVVKNTLDRQKSHLALNGNTYLWRVQQIQIELLKEFDRICRKHGLRYNISFGTLLGAVRHGGFIPWDDDIDVTLPMQDFDRLDEIMRTELDAEKYYFRCPENEENNHLIFKHLERRGTIYTKPGRNKLKQQIGVFIDIFPMYPSAHFALTDWIHAKICRYWRTALWATVGADSEPNERKRKYYKKISASGNKVCYRNFVKAAAFFKNDKYLKFWIAMDRNPYKAPLVRMSNYTDTIDVEFEGCKFMAPKDYEEVLDYCFGQDWKKYPSTRGRLPLHNAVMDIGELYQSESEGKALAPEDGV